MLKRRLIPILYIKNGLIVRSERFSYHQNLGNVVDETKRYSEWNVDELIYIDITRSGGYDLRRDDLKVKSQSTILEFLQQLSKVCMMPLTFGGGIKTLGDIAQRVEKGADKITVNTAAFTNPNLIRSAAKRFGKQCIVVSIDYKIIDNTPIVFVSDGTKSTNVNLFDWMREAERCEAGELFINSIDRDGMANGYDIAVISKAAEVTKLPVIAAGGAGDFNDFVEVAQQTAVSGIAAGNIFHFSENSYPRAKKLLLQNNINVRKTEQN